MLPPVPPPPPALPPLPPSVSDEDWPQPKTEAASPAIETSARAWPQEQGLRMTSFEAWLAAPVWGKHIPSARRP
jgi:hypothetical protein